MLRLSDFHAKHRRGGWLQASIVGSVVVAHLRVLLAIELGNAVGRVEAALRVASVSQEFVDAM